MKRVCFLLLIVALGLPSVVTASNGNVEIYIKEMKIFNDLLENRKISVIDYEQKRKELKRKYLDENPQHITEKTSKDIEQGAEPNNLSVSSKSNSYPNFAIQNINNATVQIETFDKIGSKKASGSGFIVDPSGIIVTNNHVLNNAASIVIKLANGDTYTDIIVRDFDEVKDLAIIKISGYNLPVVKLGNSSSLKVGERVLVCGFSLGEYANTISDGLISGIRQSNRGYRYFQMSAPISSGNSGGPVALESGEIIGVSTATHI